MRITVPCLVAVTLALGAGPPPARGAEDVHVDRLALLDVAVVGRLAEAAPTLGADTYDALRAGLAGTLATTRPQDVELACIQQRTTSAKAFDNARHMGGIGELVGASHVLGVKLSGVGRKVVIDVHLAAAGESGFLAKERATADDVDGAAAAAVALVGSLGLRGGAASGGPAAAYASRTSRTAFALRGGDAEGEEALQRGLSWLLRHQAEDGRWSCAGFTKRCAVDGACVGTGEEPYDVGVTGLALLALMADGSSATDGPHAEAVARGVAFLVGTQGADDGCFGPKTSAHFMYCHTIATWAVAEACGMSASGEHRDAVERAVRFLLAAQNPGAGWRYGIRDGDSDTSLVGWAVAALRAAELAGVEVPDEAFDGALAWVDSRTDAKTGRVGYQRPGGPSARTTAVMERNPADRSAALTAIGILVRMICGERPGRSAVLDTGMGLVLTRPPRWAIDDGDIEHYYWHWGTLAAFEHGGAAWNTWNTALRKELVTGQTRAEGACEDGSWSPHDDPWGAEGGRVFTTSLACLCLAAPRRYDIDLAR